MEKPWTFFRGFSAEKQNEFTCTYLHNVRTLMGGAGEEVIGGVDRRAAGRASVGGGTANCSLVVVQCWALSCSQS